MPRPEIQSYKEALLEMSKVRLARFISWNHTTMSETQLRNVALRLTWLILYGHVK